MNVYEARHAGREYCNDTEGSEHYKQGGLEPMDLYISKGLAEDFCICNMVKYAIRFKKTRNLADLRKVSDYAQILCGVELGKAKEPYDTYLEEMGEEDVGEVDEGKYADMSDEELQDKICMQNRDSITECEKCPLFKPSGGWDVENDCNAFPTFRKVAIAYLTEQDKAKEST